MHARSPDAHRARIHYDGAHPPRPPKTAPRRQRGARQEDPSGRGPSTLSERAVATARTTPTRSTVSDDAAPPARPDFRRPAPTRRARARQGVGNAFRAAFRPVDIRSDLRALPQLVRHRAPWIPVAITIATTLLFIVIRPEGRSDLLGVLTVFLYQYFVVTPAIGGVFIAGFLAPKASWLYGILVGHRRRRSATRSSSCAGSSARLHGRYPEPRARCGPGLVLPLTDHRRVLRIDRGVVPAVPVPLEPEPWAPEGQRHAVSPRRPDAIGEPEGLRPPLTARSAFVAAVPPPLLRSSRPGGAGRRRGAPQRAHF